jgi:perosamine synthetase
VAHAIARMKIPISKVYFGEEERRAVLEPLETGWVVQGPKVAEFERLFAEMAGAKHAIATTSCTTALQLGLISLGIGPGDEVIVPAFTWVASANVVEMVGAKPVIVDIELETFNLDMKEVRRAITPRTKALLPVSLFGVSAPMAEVRELAEQHGLRVIEDAACATGARYRGKHAGALADLACFSFHPRKSITTGEGGMLTTDDDARAALIRSLRDHGASKSDLARHLGARAYVLPDFDVLGYNYRMTDLQGALGVAQMARLEWILSRRRELARRYDEALRSIDWLRAPIVPAGCEHGMQAYVTLFSPERPSLENVEKLHAARNALMDRLEAAGIATRPGTHAVHMLGYYRERYGFSPQSFPNAYLADQLTLTLPVYPQMTDEEHAYVVAHLRGEQG